MYKFIARSIGLLIIVGSSMVVHAADSKMSFFITSKGPGNGADLAGLQGADQHCQQLASAVGGGHRTWHAYLSTINADGVAGENARDRVGSGPWYNVNGVKVANDVADLHSDNNQLSKENSRTELGDMVNGRGDKPNMHDVLTGSNLDGTAGESTCSNWSSHGEGSANVGHHDRTGGGANPTSWNAAHGSRGCSQADLVGTGGNGLYYCFAID